MVTKDKHGQDLKRPFAPGTRAKPEDLHKVRVVKDEAYDSRYDVGKTETGRPIVTDKEKSE